MFMLSLALADWFYVLINSVNFIDILDGVEKDIQPMLYIFAMTGLWLFVLRASLQLGLPLSRLCSRKAFVHWQDELQVLTVNSYILMFAILFVGTPYEENALIDLYDVKSWRVYLLNLTFLFKYTAGIAVNIMVLSHGQEYSLATVCVVLNCVATLRWVYTTFWPIFHGAESWVDVWVHIPKGKTNLITPVGTDNLMSQRSHSTFRDATSTSILMIQDDVGDGDDRQLGSDTIHETDSHWDNKVKPFVSAAQSCKKILFVRVQEVIQDYPQFLLPDDEESESETIFGRLAGSAPILSPDPEFEGIFSSGCVALGEFGTGTNKSFFTDELTKIVEQNDAFVRLRIMALDDTDARAVSMFSQVKACFCSLSKGLPEGMTWNRCAAFSVVATILCAFIFLGIAVSWIWALCLSLVCFFLSPFIYVCAQEKQCPTLLSNGFTCKNFVSKLRVQTSRISIWQSFLNLFCFASKFSAVVPGVLTVSNLTAVKLRISRCTMK